MKENMFCEILLKFLHFNYEFYTKNVNINKFKKKILFHNIMYTIIYDINSG